MDFSLSEEQQLIQDTAKNFALTELAPLAAKVDRQECRTEFLANLKKLAELGFMGLNVPAQYGGSESDTISFSLALTELAKGCASTAVTVSVTNMVAEVILSQGTEQQKQQYLPLLCDGTYSAGGFCLTEPHAGSDAAAISTRADSEGDTFILNGSKQFITSAEYAGVFIVWAVTDKNAKKGKGISCFLVPANTPGLIVGKAEQKMGQHGSSTNPVTFENCKIPASALLGELHQGYKIAVTELAGGRIGVGSVALGIGLSAIEYSKNYLLERKQFGRPLADFQGLQWMLVDRHTELEAARLLLLNAASKKDKQQPFSSEASMAKLFATEKANDACYSALQMLGGNGYLSDYPLERMTRDVRVTSIYEGTSEIQRMIIARSLLNG